MSHIVGELVELVLGQTVSNPFAIDFEFIQTYPFAARQLLTGALIQLLNDIYLNNRSLADRGRVQPFNTHSCVL